MPSEWRDTLLIIPMPKGEDFPCCDGWSGISPLDVMDKLMSICQST